MIPKTIHYCWFGNGEKSDLAKKCIATWKEVLPDYELREWSEKDLPLLKDNIFVQEAYESKKWAFVSDVFRLYALYHEGGIYFDTDVEVRRSFDEFLKHKFFIGSERSGHFKSIGTGIIGAQKGNPIIKRLLEYYDTARFIKPNGKPDLVGNTKKLIPVFKSMGIKKVYTHDKPIIIDEDSIIYPDTYFCCDNPDCYSVHHFEGSWGDAWSTRFKISIPYAPHKKISLRRYKRMRDEAFTYPKEMIKKLFEFDCKKNIKKSRKWLLSIDKR